VSKVRTAQGHVLIVEGDPSDPNDLATKDYVDQRAGGREVTIEDVTGLRAALDAKSDTHSHPYASSSHGHPISDVSGLQTALDGKQASGAYAAADHTHPGGGADVKSGLVNLAAGGSANVTFNTVFSSTPHVVVLSQINNADTSCTYSVHTVSVNGFTIRGAGNPVGNVAWIATNAGNP
jgi:hypothetical protein